MARPAALPEGEAPARVDPAAVQRRLRAADTLGELFARVAVEARSLGFARAVVADIADGHARATTSARLADPASDALRRRLRVDPVRLESRSTEAALVRAAEGSAGGPAPKGSAVGAALDLEAPAFGVLAPEGRALALLVADRAAPAVTHDEQREVELLGHLGGLALERLLLRLRLTELAGEVRRFATSAQAIAAESLDGVPVLPDERGELAVFPSAGLATADLTELLTAREAEIAALLVQGRSNREIAETLVLSPATIKGYVERLLRKLDASNRAEAVARYLQLSASRSGR